MPFSHYSAFFLQLDEEQLKEKKKQKLMKAGFDARVRARKEKEREREERELAEKREEDERDQDFGGWSRKLRQEQEAGGFCLSETRRWLTLFNWLV